MDPCIIRSLGQVWKMSNIQLGNEHELKWSVKWPRREISGQYHEDHEDEHGMYLVALCDAVKLATFHVGFTRTGDGTILSDVCSPDG